ncbi:glycoside hydrolase family 78 protein [Chitinophagaceae bacterium LB-8]|uniref:alpha-L-rhamnosidase n=1 Tax=Paraflavisolibacter caeni TaxID=2982496 RepID=A0A9X2XZ59_9BACT|nr:family 78 glycoside hydrolase catalytic domain [Paraflavisolibacter caeni]MCU7551581.1 glycoside hydrolase family 78 protein [Paraflavisolibacter caeni]
MYKVSVTALFLLLSTLGFAQKLYIVNLKCESRNNPLGIESPSPKLSWELKSDQRNVLQTAYRILVADHPDLLQNASGNIWDSKKVTSNASIQVAYLGKKLQPAKTYYWKVMVWDNKGNASTWSKEGTWQMGLPATTDWKGAHWIAYEKLPASNKVILPTSEMKDKYNGNNVLPLIRKSFTIQKPVKKATLFICGLGHFEASLNGNKIGDHFLDPGWTKYNQQALYVPFDVTQHLKQGTNAFGVMLGNGFYYVPPVKGRYRKLKTGFGYPKMICRLVIDYKDGTQDNIVSDASWKTDQSPIVFTSIYGGEDYHATLEQPGWNTSSFNDISWKQVLVVDGPPVLNSQMAEPVKVMETFAPRRINKIQPNIWVYDMGQNASGIPMISVQGKKGDTIRIYPSELLQEDGTPNQRPTGSPYYFEYVLKGNGIETWQPRFTYYGFRYLQVKGGIPKGENNPGNLPVINELKSLHIRNAANRVGTFTSSNELFNRTNFLIDWSVKSNMVSLFTDCPHREKLGWLEQAHLMGNSVQFNYDVANLNKKILSDMMFSQTDSGLIPEIAPEYVKFEWGGNMFRDSPEWGSTSIILPWYMYQWYGDKQVLKDCYPMMQRYISYLQMKAKNHILYQGLGDWYDLGPKPPGVSQLTPMGVTGTAIYYYDLNILSKIARMLGKSNDAAKYDQLAVEVKNAFNNKFFNKETKQYATGNQTANAMAVYMKLVEPRYKNAVVENIVKDIRNRNNSLSAGDIGYRYLLRVLEEEGRSDVIFDMNNRSDVPGYGYQLAKGATALTESWQALPNVSNNHLMLGHLMEWFYSGLAGINQSEQSIGFKEIIINPQVVGDVDYVNSSYQTPFGMVRSEWKKKDSEFSLIVSIPVNTTAVVYLPASAQNKISANNLPLNKLKDGKFLGYKGKKAMVKIGSGNYLFSVSGDYQYAVQQ